MSFIKITDKLFIASQPALDDFGRIVAEGFATFVNLRPDGEEAGQPGNEKEARAAKEVGLAHDFIPVTGQTITEADIRAFQHVVKMSRGPVYAHCKTGKRALMLHALGEMLDGMMSPEDVKAFGNAFGFDLAGAAAWPGYKTSPFVKGFYDPRTGSIQYVVTDPATKACAIIDPVLDFDEKSGVTATRHADILLDYIRDHELKLEWILDTHPHADHFSAASYLKQKTGAPTAIGAHVREVQALWKNIYNLPDFPADGSQWDRLFEEGDTFRIGALEGGIQFSPGHTLASITYVIGDAAFVHDTLFMPDSGTARADFPGGSAGTLWSSIQKILALPDETRLFTGHDYRAQGRHAKWESTVGEQKRSNPHLRNMREDDFVAMREARDKTLPMPKLILAALQVNINGGCLPAAEDNGMRYLKIPLNALSGVTW